MKKTLVVILILAVIMTIFPCVAYAKDGQEHIDVTQLSDNELLAYFLEMNTELQSRGIDTTTILNSIGVGKDGSASDVQTGEDSATDDALAQKLLSAQADEDLDSAVTAINEYYEETGNAEAVSATIAELANNTISSQNYNDYTFTDSLISRFEDFSADAAKIMSKAYENRAKAFLLGDWVRRDGSKNTGLEVNVRISGDNIIGLLTYAPKSSQFNGNEIKWADFSFYEDNLITLDDLNTAGYYIYSSGMLDYNNGSMCISISLSGTSLNNGAVQYWVKKSCLDAYGEGITLDNDDFIIEKWDGEKYETVNCNYAMYNNYVFPHFFDDGSTAREEIAKFRDGITLGSSLEDVMKVYGVGIGRPYYSSIDPVRSRLESNNLNDDLAAYDSQVVQMVYQDSSKQKCLIFGFDDNDELIFALAVPSYLYFK